MDYKTTSLNEYLECNEHPIPEFNLDYGKIPGRDILVFDSTNYYAVNNLAEIDYKTFQRMNKRYIQGLIDDRNLSPSDLFFINKNGHVLMNSQLVYLFLMFAQPATTSYFSFMLEEIMDNGIGFSDSFVYSLASNKIPTEILQRIIEHRSNATQE